MLEWILFAVCALLLFAAMVSFTGVVIGAIRFGFVQFSGVDAFSDSGGIFYK